MCTDGSRCRWQTWWKVWTGAFLGSLAIGELLGLRSGCEYGPASPNWRAYLGVKPPRPWRLLTTAGLAGGLAALLLHLTTDWL